MGPIGKSVLQGILGVVGTRFTSHSFALGVSNESVVPVMGLHVKISFCNATIEMVTTMLPDIDVSLTSN